MNGPDGLDQLPSHEVLEQVSGSAGLQCCGRLRVARVGCQYDNAGVGKFGSDGRNRLDAAHVGHAEVHQRHIRPQATKALNGLTPTAGLSDQGHILLAVQHRGDSFPQKLVIVDGKYPDHPGVLCAAHNVVPMAGLSSQCCCAEEWKLSSNERVRENLACDRLYATCAGTRKSISVPASGLLQISR